MDKDFEKTLSLIDVLEFHNCLSNGECENGGWYVLAEDAENGDFHKKKYFREGQVFPPGKWIQIPD